MEGSASEAAFDAHNLNPQRFINEILNSIDDIVVGAFDFSLQQASEITNAGDPSSDRSEELALGVSSIRQLAQGVLDKRMDMWEKYCLRHCFSVPDGFILPESHDTANDGLSFEEGSTDAELDSQLDSLRNKLAVAGKKSVELQKEVCSLENHSTLGHSYQSYITDAIQLCDQNSMHKMLQEIGRATSKLQAQIEGVKIKRKGDKKHTGDRITNSPSKRQHIAHDLNHFSRLEDIQEAAKILRNIYH